MKTKISNLPIDLVEEILSRVPVKSIVTVRSTCKNWNLLTKDQRFANKHIEKAAAAASQREKEVLMITGDANYNLINAKFYDFHNKTFDLSTKSNGIVITRQNSDSEGFVDRVFYCNGLLLCLWGNLKPRLLVWNPYWGTRRWIKCPTKRWYEVLAFGYDKSCGSHKILRLCSDDYIKTYIDIYDLSCDSWKTPSDVAFHSNTIDYTKASLSLKGNTYWIAYDNVSKDSFLHCFDFTRERFGPRLPLPYGLTYRCIESLSSVKEEKLALLLKHPSRILIMEIDVWVTDKIEPNAVSWSKLFKVETSKIYGLAFERFLIDKEKKTVVVFDGYSYNCKTNAHIIDGESGHCRKVAFIGSLCNLVANYVPNSVQV